MEILLRRTARKSDYTIGKVYINGSYFCDSLEDKDRGLAQGMPLSEIKSKKVYGKTAIPAGAYNVSWNYSNRFKRMMPLIEDVPGFSGVRIHSGNTHSDTEGCVLLGQNKQVGKVLNSKATISKFYPLVEKAYKSGEKITITIE